MNDDNDSENSTEQQYFDVISREMQCRILLEPWDLDDETERELLLTTIYAEGTAHVREFRIRPATVSDEEVEMHVKMRIGGGGAIYYLTAKVRYTDDDWATHSISIRREGAEMIDEFETNVGTASPSDIFDATQAMHETYLQSVELWYDFAVAADMASGSNE